MAGSTTTFETPTSYVYELRRAGSNATCANVKDVFRLTKHQNVFGRNSEQVDFYLNSGIHKQLISRQHAELLVYQGESANPVFVIHDRSTNGTFVNDIKVSKMARLKEFDTVTFGHVQGVSIKTGRYAEQTASEFRFVLEKIVNDSEDNFNVTDFPKFSTCPLYYNATATSSKPATQSCLPNQNTCQKPLVKSPLPEIVRLSHVSARMAAISKTNPSPCLESLQEPGTHVCKLDNLNNERGSKLKHGRGYPSVTVGDVDVLDVTQIFKTNPCLDPLQVPGTHVLDNFNNQDRSKYNLTSDNMLKPGKESPSVGDIEVLDVAATAIQRATAVMDTDSEPFSIAGDVSDFNHQRTIKDPLSDRLSDSGDIIAQDAADVTVRYPVQSKLLKEFSEKLASRRSEASTISPTSNNQDGKGKHSHTPKQPVEISTRLSSLKGLANLNGTTTQDHPLRQMSMNKLNKRTPEAPSKNHVVLKKSRRGTYRNFSKTSTAEVFVPEQCASIDCSRPLDNTISWVQCDDCDCWYHVSCMRCDYRTVKEPSAFFHCGCT